MAEQKYTLQDLIGIIAELILEFTEGRTETQNPYTRPVIRKALNILVAETGAKDKFDINLRNLVRK